MNHNFYILVGLFFVYNVCGMKPTETDQLTDMDNVSTHYIGENCTVVLAGRTLASLSLQEWKRGAADTLDLSKQRLICVDDMHEYCNKPALPNTPPLIDCAKITKLNLSRNKLEKVDLLAFRSLVNVTSCDLSHNKLKGADIGWFFRVWPDIKHINLAHNEINDEAIMWHPNHSSLRIISPDRVCLSLPAIHLEGNQITDKTKDWIIDRYKQELRRSVDLLVVGEYGVGLGCAGLMMFMGGGCVGLPVAIETGSMLGFKIAGPIGCAFGCLLGLYASNKALHKRMESSIDAMNVPIYFEQSGAKEEVTCKLPEICGAMVISRHNWSPVSHVTEEEINDRVRQNG